MTNIDRYKSDLNKLLDKGMQLQLGLVKQLGHLDEVLNGDESLKNIVPLDFKSYYEGWYSECIAVMKQLMPSRLDDFIKLYKNEKRKELDFLTYTISDALIGVVTRRGSIVKADDSAALPKFAQQLSIINGLMQRFESSLFDIKQLTQADLFDSEVASASELVKKGFLRAAGVICGVVIEKHLGQVCNNHQIVIAKKAPTISDFNDTLKSNDVIEVGVWRQIQRLGDIRNLCGHNKDREPYKEEVEELVSGTDKLLKSLY